MNRLLAAAAVTLMTTAPGRADMPVLAGVPATYTPGTDFTFDVRTPGLIDFTNFSITLVFDTPAAAPLGYTLSAVPGPGYPFPLPSGFLSPPAVPGVSAEQRLTVAGFGPAVTTVAGTNDTVARVTVSPSVGLTGPITLRVDVNALTIVADPESIPPLFPSGPFTILPNAPPPASPVPAPAGAVLAACAAGVFGARRAARNV